MGRNEDMERGELKKIWVLHVGVGRVGSEFVTQVAKQSEYLKEKYGVELLFYGLFTSDGGIVCSQGFSPVSAVTQICSKNFSKTVQVFDSLKSIEKPFVLIDTTASDITYPPLLEALKKGGYAVVSNKKPLAAAQSQFDTLQKYSGEKFFFETVVGAGLPVISTIQDMLESGDEILEMQGCFSGTLGYIFSNLDTGRLFSEVVLEAKEKGFTEPDPRDDLGGVDMARKALILARLIGQKKELSDIQLEGLYPKEMNQMSVHEFLGELSSLDTIYKEKVANAKKEKKVLRFVATVSEKNCSVGLQEVEKDADIGSLKGPDNLIVIKTKRYLHNPMVIKGPGAGLPVTAGGVFSDLLKIIRKERL